MASAVHGGVGPIEGDVVGERHVADAQVVVGPQRAERVLDGMPAFDAQQRGDPSVGYRLLDIVRSQGQLQLGIASDELPGDVDLLQLYTRVPAVGVLTRGVHRPELAAHTALPEARQIGLTRCRAPQVVGFDIPGRA